MKKELSQIVEIPEGVEVNLDGAMFTIKGPEGENKRIFKQNKLSFEKKENQIIIGNKNSTKREKKMMNTIAAHIKNMIRGVQKKFEYKLKVCFSHFPISVEVSGDKATVKNFLGEKIPRNVRIPKGVDIKVEKEIITITSLDKESAGQAAANFEASTKIRNKDRRIFQDGIFIINKDGREM